MDDRDCYECWTRIGRNCSHSKMKPECRHWTPITVRKYKRNKTSSLTEGHREETFWMINIESLVRYIFRTIGKTLCYKMTHCKRYATVFPALDSRRQKAKKRYSHRVQGECKKTDVCNNHSLAKGEPSRCIAGGAPQRFGLSIVKEWRRKHWLSSTCHWKGSGDNYSKGRCASNVSSQLSNTGAPKPLYQI